MSLTFAYCDNFLWSQQCHNKREALYLEMISTRIEGLLECKFKQ